MSDKPLLPMNSPPLILEKEPYDPTEPLSPVSERSFHGLHLGRGSHLSQTSLKERVNNLSTTKKVLFGVLSVWALGRSLKTGMRGMDIDHRVPRADTFEGYQRYDPSQWADEESTAVTIFGTYATPVLYSDINEGDTPVYTANATFELTERMRHRQITVRVGDGVECAGVIVSKEDVEAARLIVESVWDGDKIGDDVKVVSGGRSDVLDLDVIDGSHVIHLVLPLKAHRVPRLHLTSSTPSIELHSSASNLEFSHLSIESQNDIELNQIIAKDIHIETHSGKVSGTFNVSKAIVFKTVTGDIDAVVNVHPLGPPHHGRHNHTGEGKPPHKTQGHEDDEHRYFHSLHDHEDHGDGDEDDEEEDEHHHRHRSGKHDVKHDHRKRSKHESSKHQKKSRDGRKHGCSGGGVLERLKSLLGLNQRVERVRKHGKSDVPRGPPNQGKHHPHEPHHGDHPTPPHSPHPHPHGPRPIFIGAFTTTGSISLSIHQPPTLSTITKAYSHTGHVAVNGSKTFKGLFEVGTHVGNVSIATGGEKEIKVLKEVVTVTGGFVEGLVKFRGNESEGHDGEALGEDEEGDEEAGSDVMEDIEDVDAMDFEFEDRDEDSEGHKHGGPRHGPSHKGPDGPPPPPHRGPGGPPPPPHKGPKGPGGPPPHDRPPPPGFSKLFAKTDVGDVKVTL